jgi:hypothetical protein
MTDEERAVHETTLRRFDAEIGKLLAETAKINAEARYYPYIVVATVIGGIVAIVKIFSS